MQFATLFPDAKIVSSASRQLSWSHFVELLPLKDELQRDYYFTLASANRWSVRQLRKEIDGMLYERTALSSKPEEVVKQELTNVRDNKVVSPDVVFKSPYFLEFTGLKGMYSEKDLEDSLVAHLEQFILELGKGFCLESRQKRIIIDDEYYYPDLVFYNRILHCGVIIELKNEEFSYENFGQLNAYVSHYRENEMQPGDNPPIGILLCTRKGKKMVEYALAGMDNQLFVSTYMLQLPDKKTLEDFLRRQLSEQNEV